MWGTIGRGPGSGLSGRDVPNANDTIDLSLGNSTAKCLSPSELVFDSGHKFDIGPSIPEPVARLLWQYWKNDTAVEGTYTFYFPSKLPSRYSTKFGS
jgi:hypothetical protein